LDRVDLSSPTLSARAWTVRLGISVKAFWYALYCSRAVRSWRLLFSLRDRRAMSLSEISCTEIGIPPVHLPSSVSPLPAATRRWPNANWTLLSPLELGRATGGCRRPCWWMLSASSINSETLIAVLGCHGLSSMALKGMCTTRA